DDRRGRGDRRGPGDVRPRTARRSPYVREPNGVGGAHRQRPRASGVRPAPRGRLTMPLHPEARAVLDLLEALGDPPMEASTRDAVAATRASAIQPPPIALAEGRYVDADGIATRLYRPSTDVPLGLFLYFH